MGYLGIFIVLFSYKTDAQVCVRVTEGIETEKRPVIKLWCFSPRFPRYISSCFCIIRIIIPFIFRDNELLNSSCSSFFSFILSLILPGTVDCPLRGGQKCKKARMAFENFVVEIYRNVKILIIMENLGSYPESSVMLNTLHQLQSYAVKDRLTFEISSHEHPHQELVMHKYVLLREGVTKNMEIFMTLAIKGGRGVSNRIDH